MTKHYGEILELAIRKSGRSISDLAVDLDINRRSIYNWFKNQYLKTAVIHRVGVAIMHDFSQEFPELFTSEDFTIPIKQVSPIVPAKSNTPAGEDAWKDKYLNLLENYNNLLTCCIDGTCTIKPE